MVGVRTYFLEWNYLLVENKDDKTIFHYGTDELTLSKSYPTGFYMARLIKMSGKYYAIIGGFPNEILFPQKDIEYTIKFPTFTVTTPAKVQDKNAAAAA